MYLGTIIAAVLAVVVVVVMMILQFNLTGWSLKKITTRMKTFWHFTLRA